MRFHVFLLYALLVSNVVLRLFTNKLGVLPKALNMADVFLTVALLLTSFRYAATREEESRPFSFGGRLFVLTLVFILGAVLNLEFFHTPAALSQIIMWTEPLLLFLAISRLPFTESEIDGFRRLLVRLLIFELAWGALQIPIYLKTGETEAIIGTFYGNAEQYQGFIMLAVFYLMGRHQVEPWQSRKLWLMIAMILGLIVVIDNKASWLGVLVSIFVLMRVQSEGRALWFLRARYLIPVVLLFGVGSFVAIQLSPSLVKLQGLLEAYRTGNVVNLGKVKAYDDILHAFKRHWHMVLVGSGPGNFYSRSGTQFYLMGYSLRKTDSKSMRVFSSRTSNSMGGVISLTTKPPFYAQFYIDREIFHVGSGQVDSPFSSYAALLGETGVVGTLIYLGIYVGVLRRLVGAIRETRAYRPQLYPFAIAALGFFVYVMTDSLYNSWLETGRITTIAWGMAALLLKPVSAPVPDDVSEEENSADANAPDMIHGQPQIREALPASS